ncbi:MAG: hypothetical protein A2600_10165 [Candidatus Lambdaproteobacteria bacterium RIFOXYD1_FULL_56_27]|uniref:DUF2007 domain-containing protein n=1 Tax=Candidatus Lambdaproteobacteria bacterium RIFOXYD2_FULL_56_26 TaxID=1817773 RepID=A0A1F6H1S9_9PROT|nr:MAG: hypothetical protein A2426_12295 [Candidatus Lambdaproteobacteria bacterium RIFOXYC1_FULL_56_13]OGH04343.1 MAG: hypothetical protein A2557_10875 [Candidatus Lambdaproteobacteria bacterium RIFOXYD2_FULL_56_26]OGH08682.1 MAG: hypothetical protein A2600_10165 [Candidatus Lambdaproteobacteria bacterium RIFOXYD1_FULL_56_27]
MKTILFALAFTLLLHGLGFELWPEWVGGNSWVAGVEFLFCWFLADRWSDKLALHRAKQNPKVVDLKAYRKSRAQGQEQQQQAQVQWLSLYKSSDAAEVALLSSLLESKGIPFQVTGQHASSMFPQVGAIPMEILVRPTDLERGNRLIESFSNLPQA